MAQRGASRLFAVLPLLHAPVASRLTRSLPLPPILEHCINLFGRVGAVRHRNGREFDGFLFVRRKSAIAIPVAAGSCGACYGCAGASLRRPGRAQQQWFRRAGSCSAGAGITGCRGSRTCGPEFRAFTSDGCHRRLFLMAPLHFFRVSVSSSTFMHSAFLAHVACVNVKVTECCVPSLYAD